jgi:hypothetical protein
MSENSVRAACRAVLEAMAALRAELERTGDRKALHDAMDFYDIAAYEYGEDEDLELIVGEGVNDCSYLEAGHLAADIRAGRKPVPYVPANTRWIRAALAAPSSARVPEPPEWPRRPE